MYMHTYIHMDPGVFLKATYICMHIYMYVSPHKKPAHI